MLDNIQNQIKPFYIKVLLLLHNNEGYLKENELYIDQKTKVAIDELKTSYTNWLNNYIGK